MRQALGHVKGRNLVGAEIGVANGSNALDILQHLEMKKLYLVDPYAVYEEEDHTYDSHESEAIAREKLKDYKQVVFIKKSSAVAAKQIKDGSLDFVYIDANHQYESVKEDILAWWTKVKPDGILSGHDFNRDGVAKAVNELFPSVITDNDWWIMKGRNG